LNYTRAETRDPRRYKGLAAAKSQSKTTATRWQGSDFAILAIATSKRGQLLAEILNSLTLCRVEGA